MVPDDSVVQVVPPSVVARIVPPAPTAKQSALVGHEIPESVGAVPGVWLVQVDPPSVVASMWPLSMATKQSELVGHEMAFAVVKRSVVIWPAHVVPPFVVAQTLILPGEGTPTAQHFDALAHAIPLRLDVVGEVGAPQVLPEFVVPRRIPLVPAIQHSEVNEQLTASNVGKLPMA